MRRATDRTKRAELVHREETMTEGEIRGALERHWSAPAAGDQATEHEIYADDAICEYPQSGKRIAGR